MEGNMAESEVSKKITQTIRTVDKLAQAIKLGWQQLQTQIEELNKLSQSQKDEDEDPEPKEESHG